MIPPGDGGAPAEGPASTGSVGEASTRTGAVFSPPIAAVHLRGLTVAAGLVAASGVVRAVGFGAPGLAPWWVDVIGDAAWATDAALTLQRAGDGVALAWRGGKGQGRSATLVFLGPDGALRGPPQPVGASWCGTVAGAAWIAPGVHGLTRVESRPWAEVPATEAFRSSDDRALTLACGERVVFVIAEGDDDLAVGSFVPGASRAGALVPVLRAGDFGDDEGEHRWFTGGDDLTILRVSDQGAASIRRVPVGGSPTPWRRWKYAFSDDDAIAAIDGDSHATIVAFTHTAPSRCAGGGGAAESARALRVDGPSGAESVVDLADADCERSLGPFWVAQGPGAEAHVGWVERVRPAAGAAPVTAVASRAVRLDAEPTVRVAIDGDAVENAGCDDDGCFAVALVGSTARHDAAAALPLTIVRYR